jgi:methyl-accepting chemotaxis protein
MDRSWTFGLKIAAGFAAIVAFAVLVGAVAVYALRAVVDSKDRVITVSARSVIDAGKLDATTEEMVASARGFLLSADQEFLDHMRANGDLADDALSRLRAQVDSDESRRLLDRVDQARAAHRAALDRAVDLRRTGTTVEAVARVFEQEVVPRRRALADAIDAFVTREERLLEEGQAAATAAARSATLTVVAVVVLALLVASGLAYLLTRTLARQIGSAVQHVQSSSAELQSAASQQASGAKEQATAMTEISTTINELLATSRQIAESAQRVAQIAEQTAAGARTGDETVQKGQESVAGIKRQVDLIVGHMLDLGRRSQQIGGILEIVGELAEQTNILAINATIEAAGAGEAGRRFAVVADEIRKLADRVGGSTKEIRGLIEEIRSAVNTTVMATEGGTKAVEAGTRQFAEVAAAFRRIGDAVKTTTEAAREIELSTKQQTTAVEQVTAAIADIVETTRETEASSSQTLQTATQLTNLSRDLTRLVQRQASA